MKLQRSSWRIFSPKLGLWSASGECKLFNKSWCTGPFLNSPLISGFESCVLSRLVYDRETGKPKGYGFCEYQDQETALSAMRNLNGREFSGRALRVDNAASEKNKEELKSRFWEAHVDTVNPGPNPTALVEMSPKRYVSGHQFCRVQQVWEQEPPSLSIPMGTKSNLMRLQSPSAELWPVCLQSRCLSSWNRWRYVL